MKKAHLTLASAILIGLTMALPLSGSPAGNWLHLDPFGDVLWWAVVTGDPIDLGGLEHITVEAWIRPSVISGDDRVICGEWGSTALANSFLLRVNSDGTINFSVRAGEIFGINSSGTVSTDVWTHVAGVYDTGVLRIFIDGNLDGTGTTFGAIQDGLNPTYVGVLGNLSDSYSGDIDEVRISNNARYTSTFSPAYDLTSDANTVALWDFDEPLGSWVFSDASPTIGGNNELTRVNDICLAVYGSVVLSSPGPPAWTYTLKNGLCSVGPVTSWSYAGATITDAGVIGDAAASGWSVESQTSTSVVFSGSILDQGASITGFQITGTQAGSGAWMAGDISGTIDGPLPVRLVSFTALASDGLVTLRWSTESETGNLGFHIYRSLEENGPYEQITPELIPGAGSTTSRQTYSFPDRNVVNGVTSWYKIEDVAFDGTRTMHGPISVMPQAEETVEAKVLPTEFGLSQNLPNPFNPRTTISYQLPEASEVKLTVYNIVGQIVQIIVDGHKEAGYCAATWDARDLGNGIYLYRLEAGTFIRTRKMVKIE